MKNAKAIYKYSHDGEIGFMHYVVFEGKVVVLSKYDSLKVGFIEENGFLDVTQDLKSNEFSRMNLSVNTDMEYVQRVYDYMLETNNSYFQDGTEGLCALVVIK